MSWFICLGGELINRGLAGTILVYKLAAALSEQGADLDKVEAVAKYATTRLGTLGIGLDHCHVRPFLPSIQMNLMIRFPVHDQENHTSVQTSMNLEWVSTTSLELRNYP
jgi:hypothetical protein